MAAASDRYALGVGDPLIHQISNASGHVVCFAATTILDVEIPKFFPVSGAAAVVRVQHYVPLLREKQRPRRENERVLTLRPSVNPKDRGIARSRLVARREIQNPADGEPVLALEV